MLRAFAAAVLVLVVWLGLSSPVWGAPFQWPGQMTVGGFNITDIKGTAKDDGSGSATGSIQIQGIEKRLVTLTRSARGEVTGKVALNTRVAGTAVQAELSLGKDGLKGTGSLQTSPKPLTAATISVNSRGQFSGSGKIALGKIAVPTEFALVGGSLRLSGTASVQVRADSALAVYKLEGSLTLKGGPGKIDLTLDGKVERTGKLAKQSTTTKVSKVNIDPNDGKCKIDVDGVAVTFSLF